ncbi:DNA-3-methyladenine glycosylase [Acuticoccus sp. I52.16.1]|uniref:DNA-3-methyladenine glycosylase family protein n=1 Tax=Acuticoccus sp. I52.16.1 TaxID=2928472 RepID=UPI001FD1CEC2|nr:DNA-3-methyladenine glycosylase 2 family protein [Acuticoccus sp. I52.16.1]UOM36034.1 DNA-3-methyladenine glycosylase 2 family protein [Acuticoccus sp. I52.16.1]
MDRIRTEADVAAALDRLAAADPRIAAARAAVDHVPLRLLPGDFAGMCRIIAGQQLSTQSAAACYAKVAATFDPLTAEAILAVDEPALRAAGLSRQKAATVRALAEAVDAGLDLDTLAERPAEEARAALEAIRGIGRWSADLYLMFCAGHPDIFPVGDLAVRRAAQRVLGLAQEPAPAALDTMAMVWAPHRSVAARLMWAYYRTGRPAPRTKTSVPEGAPL